MAVLLNRKICDNASECSGIEVCPTGAIFWNPEENMISINNELCVSCRECVSACPVGAFAVADNESEYNDIMSEFEADTRSSDVLFVERYGAMPIDEEAVVDEDNLHSKLDEIISGIVLVEKFKDNSIECLLHSIPIETLTKKFNANFIKCYVEDDKVGTYPQLLIFINGKHIGTVEGYYEDKSENALVNKIETIIKNA